MLAYYFIQHEILNTYIYTMYMIYESYKGNIIIINFKLYKKTSNKMVPNVSFDKDITPYDKKFHLIIYDLNLIHNIYIS